MAVQLLLHGWPSHPCKNCWKSFQLFENKLDTRRVNVALFQKARMIHLSAQIQISDTESDWGEKNQRCILGNKGKYVTTMIRVTRSVRVPDGRSQSLSVLKENVLGLQIFLVENLDYGKNNLGHILPIKLSEVLWDKEMSERIPGQIPPWLLFTATNFAANSCAPLAPSEHLLNNFKYIPLPFRH